MGSELGQHFDNELQTSEKALSQSNLFFDRINMIYSKLCLISSDIKQHISEGDLQNNAQNSKLWHDLNNIDHQLKQFYNFEVKSLNLFISHCDNLITELRNQRPPK